MSACCPTFEKRGRWLFSAARASGSPVPSFCPWCGKGVTSPPVATRMATVLGSSMVGKRAAMLAVKDWAKGKPGCARCSGLGYTLHREGCCSLKPVPCPCTQDQVPGKPVNTGGQA